MNADPNRSESRECAPPFNFVIFGLCFIGSAFLGGFGYFMIVWFSGDSATWRNDIQLALDYSVTSEVRYDTAYPPGWQEASGIISIGLMIAALGAVGLERSISRRLSDEGVSRK